MKTSKNFPKKTRPLTRIMLCLASLALVAASTPANAANLVAHWTLNEASPPYADSTTNLGTLYLDPDTYGAPGGPGTDGGACAHLDWNSVPGTSTRLFATNSAIQTDSFGFSFWMLPNWVNEWDNLIVKEMAYDPIAPDWAKQAWQLHFLGDFNADGNVALELVVRGTYRTNVDHVGFFGVVSSADNLPMHQMYTNWVHVAGGYDAVTGDVTLYVNGVQFLSPGTPGATNSDGSPLSIGTAKNGDNQFINFAAGTWIDDVRIYDGPLTQAEVNTLRSNNTNFNVTKFARDSGTGDLTLVYPSAGLQSYTVYAATNLTGSWLTVSNVIATDLATTNVLTTADLDAKFGASPRKSVFVRVSRP